MHHVCRRLQRERDRGYGLMQTKADKGEGGVIFARFMRTFIMDNPYVVFRCLCMYFCSGLQSSDFDQICTQQQIWNSDDSQITKYEHLKNSVWCLTTKLGTVICQGPSMVTVCYQNMSWPNSCRVRVCLWANAVNLRMEGTVLWILN